MISQSKFSLLNLQLSKESHTMMLPLKKEAPKSILHVTAIVKENVTVMNSLTMILVLLEIPKWPQTLPKTIPGTARTIMMFIPLITIQNITILIELLMIFKTSTRS